MALFWSALPREIEAMIFEELIADKTRRPGDHILAKCASVCDSWSCYFEPVNYSKIRLSQSCLPEFHNMIRDGNNYRLKLINCLWLRVRLDEYDCGVCQQAEDADTMKRNCTIFTEAVWVLLRILSTEGGAEKWNRKSLGGVDGMKLEISIYSPSDNKHVFRPLCLNDDCPYTDWFELTTKGDEDRLHEELSQIHDPPHGWTQGVHKIPSDNTTNASGRDRLLGSKPVDFDFSNMKVRAGTRAKSRRDKKLPRVGIISHLTVRRSTFRGISPRVLFKLLHESLVHVKMVRLEKWLELYSYEQDEWKLEFERQLHQYGLPKSIKEIHLLEDTDKKIHPRDSRPSQSWSLGMQLSRATRSLEHISITNVTQAGAFFHDYFSVRWDRTALDSPTRAQWPDLRVLTVTCQMFRRDKPHVNRDILRAASIAARLMPRLELMQIWDCGGGEAGLFEYEVRRDGQPPLITWRTTWPTFTKHDKAFDGWRSLAQERDVEGREPEIRAYSIASSQDTFRSKWGLRDRLHPGLLHPASEKQLTWEEKMAKAKKAQTG